MADSKADERRIHLTDELSLLLLCARLHLDAEQQQRLLRLCARIDNWPQLLARAECHFVLALLRRHLQPLVGTAVPAEIYAQLSQRCLLLATRTLNVAADQRHLIREVLVPLQVPYVLFKGHVLGTRYYENASLRPCRDIDILVHGKDMHQVATLAQERGFCVMPYEGHLNARDLEAAIHFRPVLSLCGPRGVAVELHSYLDHTNTIYPTDQLLTSAEVLEEGEGRFNVLPIAEAFVHACQHHTRHTWSHLHWLADLDAMMRHPSFNLEQVREVARRWKLEATVEVSIAFQQLLATPAPWVRADLDPRLLQMLEASLYCLDGGPMAELRAKKHRSSRDFAFAWQTTRSVRLRDWIFGLFDPLRPNYADYKLWPLPLRWRWIYVLTRPFTAMARWSVRHRTPHQ